MHRPNSSWGKISCHVVRDPGFSTAKNLPFVLNQEFLPNGNNVFSSLQQYLFNRPSNQFFFQLLNGLPMGTGAAVYKLLHFPPCQETLCLFIVFWQLVKPKTSFFPPVPNPEDFKKSFTWYISPVAFKGVEALPRKEKLNHKNWHPPF